MTKRFIAALLLSLIGLPGQADDEKVTYYLSEEMAGMNLPFSSAVIVGDVIYLSGQLGTLPGQMKLAEGGIEAETHQIFANMKGILEANNSSLDKIFKCTVMMDDIALWPKFNEVYVTYFPGDKPARSAFGTDGLALGGAVEIGVLGSQVMLTPSCLRCLRC